MNLLSAVVLVAGCLLHVTAVSETLNGNVVAVSDGDTITVLDASNEQHKIRLAGIDAPEKKQPFGQASKQSLSDMVYGKKVEVEYTKRDRYGRTIGKVHVNGDDVCLRQITFGMAWHYKKYQKDQPPEDRYAYASAENDAKAGKRGLWRDENPVPPWKYRHP